MATNNVMKDFNDPRNWKKTAKKNYEVYVCRPKSGTQVTNRLEGSNYVTDQNKQFVISGTVGETWVIDAGKLAKTYSFMDGTPINTETLKSKMRKDGLIDWMHFKTLPGGGATNWAFHLPLSIRNFPVQTSWGDTLYANRDGVGHGVGDFLVCADANGQPNLNDVWVVNGEIFPTTYDMRAFPGLVPAGATNAETPKPASIIGECLSNDELQKRREKEEKEKRIFAKYQEQARDIATNKVIPYYSKYSKSNVSNIQFKNKDHGSSGNYQMLEDYNYVDYGITFIAGNTPVEAELSFIDGDASSPIYLNIWIKDNEHNASLRYERDAFKSVGLPIDSINDAVLTEYFNRLFGLNQKVEQTKAKKPAKKGIGGLFDMFKR